MLTRRTLVLALLTTVLAGVACSGEGPPLPAVKPPSEPSPVVERLRIGYIPIADCAQVYAADSLGVFRENHLQVELVPLTGGAGVLQALAAGTVDVAFSNLASAVFYEENAEKLSVLAGGTKMDASHSEAGTVVLDDSPVKAFVDLKGRTIAVNALNNIVDLAILRAARRASLAPTDIHRIELPFKDMEIALRGKKVDAVTLPEPFLRSALNGGGVRSIGDHFAAGFGDVYSTAYFTTLAARVAKPSAYSAFDKAIAAVTPTVNTFTPEVAAAVATATKVKVEDATAAGRPLYVDRIPDSAMPQMRAWMVEEGMLVSK
ncbi:MAG: ABC transporter substrate-binding protein [Pseudomonadota bacterium]|nr:ABC transporter substrate-binding protein [Pseudomonadota bacterium]